MGRKINLRQTGFINLTTVIVAFFVIGLLIGLVFNSRASLSKYLGLNTTTIEAHDTSNRKPAQGQASFNDWCPKTRIDQSILKIITPQNGSVVEPNSVIEISGELSTFMSGVGVFVNDVAVSLGGTYTNWLVPSRKDATYVIKVAVYVDDGDPYDNNVECLVDTVTVYTPQAKNKL